MTPFIRSACPRNIAYRDDRPTAAELSTRKRMTRSEVKRLLQLTTDIFRRPGQNVVKSPGWAHGRDYTAQREHVRVLSWAWINGLSFEEVGDRYGHSKEHVRTLIRRHADLMEIWLEDAS